MRPLVIDRVPNLLLLDIKVNRHKFSLTLWAIEKITALTVGGVMYVFINKHQTTRESKRLRPGLLLVYNSLSAIIYCTRHPLRSPESQSDLKTNPWCQDGMCRGEK